MRVVGARRATLIVLSNRGSEAALSITDDDCETRLRPATEAMYVRAQVIDGCGNMLAVSNPIWLE